jgi:hypothetical protein
MSKWFCDTFTGVATRAARCGSFVEEGFGLLAVSYRWTWWIRRFTWFGSSERNTLCSQENEVVLLKPRLARVSLSLSFFDPLEVASTWVFYSSRLSSYNELQGTTGGFGQVKHYAIGHHRSGVTNDVFNDVGTPGLVACLTALGQQCVTILLRHWLL